MTKPAFNILFFTKFRIDANKGGVQRITETLAIEFLKRGYGVYYLALAEGTEEVINGVRQFYIPEPSTLTCNKNAAFFRDLLEKLQISVIINQTGINPSALSLIEESIDHSKAIHISVYHNSVTAVLRNYENIIRGNFGNKFWFRIVDNRFMWFLMKSYSRRKHIKHFQNSITLSDRFVLYFSLFEREIIDLGVKYDSLKVVDIPNPVPFKVVEGVERKKENRLVFVGRLNYQQKRADLLIDLWRRIYSEHPGWAFDIVGSGPVQNELEQRAKDEGLERIYFHGYHDPRPFLEKAKFFCMTSAFEGFGMVLVEAQAFGVVPFAFDCFRALPEIIQSGKNGFIFPKFNISQYAQTLKQLMCDEELRRKMAINGQKSVLKFHPRIICDKWVYLFEKLESGRTANLTNENTPPKA